MDRQRQLEIDLLMAAARPNQNFQGERLRSWLKAPVDWPQLRALAHYHRLQPVLYKRLMEQADLVPQDLLREMAEDFRAGATRNLHLTSELITLTKAFARAEIPVLPHKGPLLAQAVYGDLALRQFNDLDLLVHPADLTRSIALLAKLDYWPPPELAWLSPRALIEWTGEMSYASPQGTAVDLHWRLTPSHYTVQLDPEILWRHVTPIRVAGSELLSLAPEALLLLLAVHGAKHYWESLGWLADVAWLLDANPNLDWQYAVKLADESNCQRPLLLAASLAHKVFEAHVPELPMDSAAGRLQQRVLARWYTGRLETPGSPELLSFALELARGRSGTLKHLFGLLFYPTEIEWSTRRLPESLFWLYAPGRAARLSSKYFLRT